MVALIPKKMFDLELLNKLLVTYNARKELGLSQHFPKFLGYNTQADPCCFQYFSEYSDGRKLGDLIASSKIAL